MGGGVAGLTEIKANSASQQSWSWSWGLAELGNKFQPKQEMESKLISAQTGNGTMKMCTNCRTNLSVDSLPPKGKDIQLLID